MRKIEKNNPDHPEFKGEGLDVQGTVVPEEIAVSDPKDVVDENELNGEPERSIALIDSEISDLLVKQIAHELFNHSLYKTFSNYYAVRSYDALAEFFEKRSVEEFNHYSWIKSYLEDCNVQYSMPQIDKVEVDIKSLLDPFELTVVKEQDTTMAIKFIAMKSFEKIDFQTFYWLEKLIQEQREEEALSINSLSIAKMDAPWLIKSENILELLEK